MKLTIKQKKFADAYIELGNASAAAISAGYSKKTARSIGQENLTKPAIKEYIQERLNTFDTEVIATQEEILRTLTDLMRAENVKEAYRIKAAELLMKKYQMFDADKDQTSNDINITIDFEGVQDE